MLTESEVTVKDANDWPRAWEGAEVVIRLENVFVEYIAPRERITSFKEYIIRLIQRRVRHEEFKALRNVNIEVRQGEFFGIIGRNGAGKSTLLKIISRVMKPTGGRVWVKGRVAPLLELGAGFHLELTGRENVYLNGTLLGYTHAEIDALFESIVEFAGLKDFIDVPLRSYSTGMAVRLGFAVATATRPDILIVDEVLAVGDEQFQEKCSARMTEYRQSGTTILFVTHDSKLALRLCDRVTWLDRGEVRLNGDPMMVIDRYHEAYQQKTQTKLNKSGSLSLSKHSRTDGTTEDAELSERSEDEALGKEWFYRFVLPSGRQTPCYLQTSLAGIHDDRLLMMTSVLQPLFGEDWKQVSALDLGCHEGFFALKLAEKGCRKVLGIDAAPEKIADAELIRRIYRLPNLSFSVADLLHIDLDQFEKFDLVLMFDLLPSLENPIGALRAARTLTKQILLVETKIAPDPHGTGEMSGHHSPVQRSGSFALVDQDEQPEDHAGGSTGFSLYPTQETLIRLMKRLGFRRVEVVHPPLDVNEQLATNKRIIVAGYV